METIWTGTKTKTTEAKDLVVGDVVNYRGSALWKITEIASNDDGSISFAVTRYRGRVTATLRSGALDSTFELAGHVPTKTKAPVVAPEVEEIPVADEPDFEFETVEKIREELQDDDEVVGIRISGTLVCRFLRGTPDGDVDFELGRFWTGGTDCEEDEDGTRIFVVRASRIFRDEALPEIPAGTSVRFVERHSTGVLCGGGPTAQPGFETIVEETVSAGQDAVLVRFPADEDGFAPRQYVPRSVLEVEPDFSDSTHCRHGSFVGDWAGPDYLCGACENGETAFGPLPSEVEFEARVDARAREIVAEEVHETVVRILSLLPYSTRFADAVIDVVYEALDGRPPIKFVRVARAELAGATS